MNWFSSSTRHRVCRSEDAKGKNVHDSYPTIIRKALTKKEEALIEIKYETLIVNLIHANSL